MERYLANPCVCSPGWPMYYCGFLKNLHIHPPGPCQENEYIRPTWEEVWSANRSILMPQEYGINCIMPHQTLVGLLGPELAPNSSTRSCSQYDTRFSQNLTIQIPEYDYTQSILEMPSNSKASKENNSSILGEKSATGCKDIGVSRKNRGARKIKKSSCDVSSDRQIMKKISDIGEIKRGIYRRYKRRIDQVIHDSQDLVGNQTIKKAREELCTTELYGNACDYLSIKTNNDESDIDVETLGDDDKDGRCDDPVETSFIDVVGLSDYEVD